MINTEISFQDQIKKGIPTELPAIKEIPSTANRAPKRKDILSVDEKKLAIRNALRYFPAKWHVELAAEFKKELDKWSVCKYEDKLLQDIKVIKSDKTGVSENDKKPYRGQFFDLQRSYISDFESQFGDEMRKFFPFLSDDFTFLKSLKLEEKYFRFCFFLQTSF